MRTWLILLGALALTACTSRYEVDRVSSPDGRLDAIVVESNSGATTSFGHTVYIAPQGKSESHARRVASFYGATRNASVSGVNPRWMAGDILIIEYFTARNATLRRESIKAGGRRVHIELRPGVEAPAH